MAYFFWGLTLGPIDHSGLRVFLSGKALQPPGRCAYQQIPINRNLGIPFRPQTFQNNVLY